MENRQNGVPLAVYFSSGSFPSRPTRITLFTDFAIRLLKRLRPLPVWGFSRRRLKVLEFCRSAGGFDRTWKLRHNILQSGSCQLRICFGLGEAFLEKGRPSFIAVGKFLQDN